jgi:hypothetical protein
MNTYLVRLRNVTTHRVEANSPDEAAKHARSDFEDGFYDTHLSDVESVEAIDEPSNWTKATAGGR